MINSVLKQVLNGVEGLDYHYQENRHLRKYVSACSDYGAPTGNRTPNLLIKSQLLCQLSYRRVFCLTGNVKKPLCLVKPLDFDRNGA